MAGLVQPERSWDGTLTLQQVIYDERAHANLDVSKRMQRALEHDYAGQELDIVQIAAQGYFNVLRAKTFERIQQDNLRLTRSHLELARVRQAAGSAGPGEVYRWESEVATRRIGFTDANALRASAEIDLNRILNLPQEDGLVTEESGIEDELLAPTRAFAQAYLDTPRRFALFRDFLVQEGLARAPELHRLDEAIAAQERVRTAAHRAYSVPTVGLQAEVKRDFAFGGQGSGGLAGLFMPGMEEDTSWNIAMRASLPLYAGGARRAGRIQAHETLEQLQRQREAAGEKIEERIRVAAHQVRAAYANIRHAEAASAAAGNNLGLVTDAYARGVASAIDLLDAQNAVLVARLGAAGSVYQFHIDLVEMERAAASFVFRMDETAYAEWVGRVEAYFAEHNGGVVP
jgi:outer membrane protein TolC